MIYSASPSEVDKRLHAIFRKCSSAQSLLRLRPFVFGGAKLSENGERLLNKDNSRIFLENLEKERMKCSLKAFGGADNQYIYDPEFMLFAICDLVRPDAHVDPKLLIKSGAFSFVLMGLTLESSDLRSVALEALVRIKGHLIIHRWSNFNLISSFFSFLEEVLEPKEPLKSAVAVYFCRVVHLLLQPEHEMYQPTMASVVHMESFSDSVPDFIDHFWASVNTKRRRLWMVNFMKEILVKVGDLSSLHHYHALEYVIAALNTEDPRLYECILELVERLVVLDSSLVVKRGVPIVIRARQKLRNERLPIEGRILSAVSV